MKAGAAAAADVLAAGGGGDADCCCCCCCCCEVAASRNTFDNIRLGCLGGKGNDADERKHKRKKTFQFVFHAWITSPPSDADILHPRTLRRTPATSQALFMPPTDNVPTTGTQHTREHTHIHTHTHVAHLWWCPLLLLHTTTTATARPGASTFAPSSGNNNRGRSRRRNSRRRSLFCCHRSPHSPPSHCCFCCCRRITAPADRQSARTGSRSRRLHGGKGGRRWEHDRLGGRRRERGGCKVGVGPVVGSAAALLLVVLQGGGEA